MNSTWKTILQHVDGNNEGDPDSHRATLVPQLTVTKQRLTVVYERVSLLFIQVLQFVYVVLTLRLPFPHVDFRQNLLNYSDLKGNPDH